MCPALRAAKDRKTIKIVRIPHRKRKSILSDILEIRAKLRCKIKPTHLTKATRVCTIPRISLDN
jgi:hypothetical protein